MGPSLDDHEVLTHDKSPAVLAVRIGACEHQTMPTVLRPMAAADVDDVVTLQGVGAIVSLGHIFLQDEHPFLQRKSVVVG